MPIPYVVPGVSVSEVVSPSFAPSITAPTSLCVIGPGQGFEAHTETVLLHDSTSYSLQTPGVVASSLVVVDASNTNSAPFVASSPGAGNKDYTVDTSLVATTGVTKISRAMQTTIVDGQQVVVYYENSASPAQSDGKTERLILVDLVPDTPLNVASGTQAASVLVMSQGVVPVGDYTLTGAGTGTVTIQRQFGATVIGKYQSVYVNYMLSGSQYNDVALQFNGTTTVSLPANSTAHVVKTAPGVFVNAAARYTKASAITDADYYLSGVGVTTAISRSAGTTLMGVANDGLIVNISYQAIPPSYYLATKCFNQGQVEAKFGASFDSTGTLINPVSFGASLAFQNGASSVIVQALYSANGGVVGAPTGVLADWTNTLAGLQGVEEINLIVPIHSCGSLITSDGLSLQIESAIHSHIQFMDQNNVRISSIIGEDSTTGNANFTTLRAHGGALGGLPYAERLSLLSPASFNFSNPINGHNVALGGQFVAACVAGKAASGAVQNTLTHTIPVGITGVNDSRASTDKNIDGASGLMVIENYKGVVRIRHAITTSRASVAASELNVVRAKNYMIDQMAENLDAQIIGQIPMDTLAPFRVQLLAVSVLEDLISSGVIVTYRGVQAQQDEDNPSAIDLVYSYLPSYPLNYVNISFSIDSSLGVVTSTTDVQTTST